jgi:heme exporter protein B
MASMWRDLRLVAAKDLRIEQRSRVLAAQVAPFALVVLILFAFALDPDRGILESASPGLFWVTVLFVSLSAVQRSFAVELADGGRDLLRLSGLEPAAIFLGKALALAIQLAALELLLFAGVVVLYGTELRAAGVALALATSLAATVGLATAGTLYGALAAGLRVRDTLLPLLLLPILTPVLLGCTRAFEAALGTTVGTPISDGWPWVALLVLFALVYTAGGAVAFGPLLEDS